VHIGSDTDEGMVGPAELRKLLERALRQLDASSWHLGWHSVSAAGSVAWLVADLNGQVARQGYETLVTRRVTMVLQRRGDEWLIVHSHSSLPDSQSSLSQTP
jgi:ketosteroid isomerase-like protein